MQPRGDHFERLSRYRQEHLLSGWDHLADAEREELLRQISRIDFEQLAQLHARREATAAALPQRSRIEPMPVLPATCPPEVRQTGEEALRQGRIGVLLVAGGQGSRLNFDRPKGMFPVGPVRDTTLFRIHAEKVLALSRRHGVSVPLFIMTSPATHAETEAYFETEGYFGLSPRDVFFFQQGTMPAVDLASGRVLLEQPGQIFLSPNGHGGILTALAETGMLNELEARGVQHLFYFQVDNPLVKIGDAGFVGRHIASRSQASSKVVFKEEPGEKVGVLALIDGRCGIIEYSDLPAEIAAERDEQGILRFRAGSPAIHIFEVAFLRWVTAGKKLAFHIARKKVPHHDPESGQRIVPATENALKFELFIFDALPLAERSLAMETSRFEEFAPLKNASGPDSPATVKAAISRLHAGWLKAAGAKLPFTSKGEPAFPIEISPLFALDAEECANKIAPGQAFDGPTYLG